MSSIIQKQVNFLIVLKIIVTTITASITEQTVIPGSFIFLTYTTSYPVVNQLIANMRINDTALVDEITITPDFPQFIVGSTTGRYKIMISSNYTFINSDGIDIYYVDS